MTLAAAGEAAVGAWIWWSEIELTIATEEVIIVAAAVVGGCLDLVV